MHSLVKRAFDSEWSAEEIIKSGRSIMIRSIRPSDANLIKDELSNLSEDSIYHRFLTFKESFSDKEVSYFTEVDLLTHIALVAMVEENGKPVLAGIGRYIVNSADVESAELAFEVIDRYQGQGIGSSLLQHLIRIARSNGLTKLTALVLADNNKMLNVFAHSGLPLRQKFCDQGLLEIELTLSCGLNQHEVIPIS
jgi:GNAT superfamily N-acetyltransferase